MITKKEILERIKSLEIDHINQIDTDYQLDVEVIELFIRTHYAFGDISEIEKDKKVNLLITKVIDIPNFKNIVSWNFFFLIQLYFLLIYFGFKDRL